MEISSINTAYTMGINDYAVKKNDNAERKNQTNNVEEYYEKLCKKLWIRYCISEKVRNFAPQKVSKCVV